MELDSLDRKLLYLLDQDGRATYKKLAKATRSSAEVVRYRIKRLIGGGVISDFMLLLNFSEFGFVGHGVFCRIASEKGKKEAVEYLISHPRVYWVAEFGGRYDIAFALLAKDSLEFYHLLLGIKKKTSSALTGWDTAIRIQLSQFPREYLLQGPLKKGKVAPYFGREVRHRSLDGIDFAILKELSQKARSGIISLSGELGIPPSTVSFRIKRLRQDKIIQGVSPRINCHNFGYQNFQLFISARDLDSEKREKLFNYCLSNPNIIFFIEALGSWNFEIIYETRDERVFQREMVHLREKFPWITNMEMGILFDHLLYYNHFPLDGRSLATAVPSSRGRRAEP